MEILVGYASAHGSTAEIATFIGKELEQREFKVTVANVADIKSLEGYNAYVLGSAIHGFCLYFSLEALGGSVYT